MAFTLGNSFVPEIVPLPPLLPPPTAPLPALPLQAKAQAPPPTPRNAGQLYGEFSWPSLDIAMLVSRMEEVAESRDREDLDGPLSPEHITPDNGRFRAGYPSTVDRMCGDDCPVEDFLGAVIDNVEADCPRKDSRSHPPSYGEPHQIKHDVVPGGDVRDVFFDTDSGTEDIYHTCSEGEDSNLDIDYADTDGESGFLGSKDWAELLRMLGWLGGFDGDAQEQLLELNERARGEKRWCACIDEGYEG